MTPGLRPDIQKCLRIPFLFTLTASFIREKPIEEAYPYILFQTVFTWLFQLQGQEGSGSITQDIIFQHPLKPEGGPEGDTNNVFSKEDRLRQQFSPRLT